MTDAHRSTSVPAGDYYFSEELFTSLKFIAICIIIYLPGAKIDIE